MNNFHNYLRRAYDEQEYALVCRKKDFDANTVGDGMYLVPLVEWDRGEDAVGVFHLYLTVVANGRIRLYTTESNEPFVNNTVCFTRKKDYSKI